MLKRLIIAVAALFVVAGCSDRGKSLNSPGGDQPQGETIYFSSDIKPIFDTRCTICHGPQLQQNGLRLDNYGQVMQGGISGAVIVPFAPDRSILVMRLEGAIQPRMPFGSEPLSSSEIQKVRDWISQGAVNNQSVPSRPAMIDGHQRGGRSIITPVLPSLHL